MKFVSKITTDDGRLTAGATYYGAIITVPVVGPIPAGLRIVVYDNKGQWMTFNSHVFEPAKETL